MPKQTLVSVTPGYFPRVLGVYAEDSTTAHYRIHLPLKILAENGFKTGWVSAAKLDQVSLDDYDMVVVAGSISEEMYDLPRSAGKVLIADLSDVRQLDWNFHLFDGVIAANDGYAVTALKATRNVEVLPDYVDPRLWPSTPRIVDPNALVIGLFQSPLRERSVEDWRQIAEPMQYIMDTYPFVEFIVGSRVPTFLSSLATLAPEELPYDRLPFLLNSVDIGLIPYLETSTNIYLSQVPAFEYGLAGAAVVASPAYAPILGGKGTIARTPIEWARGIEKYIASKQKRDYAARNLRNYVESRWNIGRHVSLIADVYRRVYQRAVGVSIRAKSA